MRFMVVSPAPPTHLRPTSRRFADVIRPPFYAGYGLEPDRRPPANGYSEQE